jgi:hypothetical protein
LRDEGLSLRPLLRTMSKQRVKEKAVGVSEKVEDEVSSLDVNRKECSFQMMKKVGLVTVV